MTDLIVIGLCVVAIAALYAYIWHTDDGGPL